MKGLFALPLLPDEIDFVVNSILEGTVQNTAPTGINLVDTDDNPLTPVSITQIGNIFEIKVSSGSPVPAQIQINGVNFKTVDPADTLNILIRNSDNVDVGTPDSVNNRVDIADSSISIRKSDGTQIALIDIPAEDLDLYNVADSTVTNDATSPTYTQNVKATEPLVLPAQTIEVNGVNEGAIPSVGTIEVELSDGVNPVTPDSVGIVGRKIEIEVPSGAPPAFPPEALVIEVGTTFFGNTDDNEFVVLAGTFPSFPSTNYNVKTSDGQILNGNTGNLLITFPTPGRYIIEITGNMLINYSPSTTLDRNKIINILQFGTDVTIRRFEMCSNMDIVATDTPKMFTPTMIEAFRGPNRNIGNEFIQNWDFTGVTDVRGLFRNNQWFNQPLNNLETSSFVLMGGANLGLFAGAISFNQPLNLWDVSAATNMRQLFLGATKFNQYLGDWQLNSGLTTMERIFANTAMSIENYTDTIVAWANQVFDNSGSPSGVNMTNQTGRTFDTSRSGGANFANAGAARTYLTTTAGWSITGDTVI